MRTQENQVVYLSLSLFYLLVGHNTVTHIPLAIIMGLFFTENVESVQAKIRRNLDLSKHTKATTEKILRNEQTWREELEYANI